MEIFQRTSNGLIAKFLFYTEPIIFVEGRTDIPIYEHIVEDLIYRFEVAGGKEECKKISLELIKEDYPYTVIMDGGYEILEHQKSEHSRIIILNRHSVENYLFEKGVIEKLCKSYVPLEHNSKDCIDEIDKLIKEINSNLYDLLLLDITHTRNNTGFSVFPKNINSVIDSNCLTFSKERIKALYSQGVKNIEKERINESKKLLDSFLDNNNISNILEGHFIFSVLRYFVIFWVKSKNNKNPIFDNDTLRITASTFLWNKIYSNDHKTLRNNLRKNVLEVRDLLKEYNT